MFYDSINIYAVIAESNMIAMKKMDNVCAIASSNCKFLSMISDLLVNKTFSIDCKYC